MTAEDTTTAAEKLFALTGRSVDNRLAEIAKSADAALRYLQKHENENRCRKPNDPTYRPKEIAAAAMRNLDLCVRTFGRPPPAKLVDLIAHLLRVSKEPIGRGFTPDYWEAVRYVAEHPKASNREVGRAVGNSKDTIRTLRQGKVFQNLVEIERRYFVANE